MALNRSGVRDTARVLHVSPSTVIREFKKKEHKLQQVNLEALKHLNPEQVKVDICLVQPPEKAEGQKLSWMRCGVSEGYAQVAHFAKSCQGQGSLGCGGFC
jgi:hypothetical protein